MKQLVYYKDNYIILEFDKNKTIIHEKYLKRAMEQIGIVIPPGMRKAFDNQDVVKLGDPRFQKAFQEIYYPLVLDRSKYMWRER